MPKRDILVENLENSGYTIEALIDIEGSDFVLTVFWLKKERDLLTWYMGYLLKMLLRFLNCTADFSKAGFTTTDNVGDHYIND